MSLRPTEAAERAFKRAGIAADRAVSHVSTGDQRSYDIAMAGALKEVSEGLANLATAQRQTFEIIDKVNGLLRGGGGGGLEIGR